MSTELCQAYDRFSQCFMKFTSRLQFLSGLISVLALSFQQATAAEDFRLSYHNDHHILESVQKGSIDYFDIEKIADALELTLHLDGERLLLKGLRSTLSVQKNRPLAQSGQRYVLLSGPVSVDTTGKWFAPRDFIENALPLILQSQLQLESLPPGYDQIQISVQVLNSANSVSLIFLPSSKMVITTREEENSIEIEFDKPVQFVEPGVRPEVSLVASLSCRSSETSALCSLTKGFDFRSHQADFLDQPHRLILNVLSMVTEDLEDPLAVPEKLGLGEEASIPVVTIDAGHGGEDRGITSGPLFEKDLVRKISMLLENSLQRLHFATYTTRNNDFNLSLALRASIANTNQSAVFISLHLGGSHSSDVQGPLVYVHAPDEKPLRRRRGEAQQLTPWYNAQQPYLDKSRKLAKLIQSRLNNLFGTSNSVEAAPLEVLAPIQAPAVLIEAGFLTNFQDSSRLEDVTFQESVADSIAESIRVFLR